MQEKSPSLKIKMIAEHANLSTLDERHLTNNVYAIRYEEDQREWVDLVQGRMVDIFDAYYDLGYLVKQIWHAGGRRNPKLQNSELRVVGG